MMRMKPLSLGIPPARAAHLAGALAVAFGLFFWGGRLLGSTTSAGPAQAMPRMAADPASDAVAAWLGPGDVRLNVALLGLVSGRGRAVALLSVNDAAPRAYVAGEPLMRDVVLQAVDAGGVTVLRAGQSIRIAAPPGAEPAAAGIVRVP